ncbi:putative bifunctional diguanylate cyclase/phosphodiesterase [Chamaesiphon minutus]|uniref:Diguanylate cyclase (GGDEF) domain-containing protein n=1 Tax=Chamaesiphon minutus (strain ATCC 27169 / PCC 6605) TaxID=1173020 RepID=K9UM61_CHAP6|nr:EAL domain-containing protein [Chamaesiphon minutus]AFY96202.1 diguanylate cyclase (GGDEF) domain-containing protein [Chamaesiphon minutus PCC 6605]
MKMLCSSPSVRQLKPELLADIARALNADGSRLLILAQPLVQHAQIYSYGLQPRSSMPIEKNRLWQNVIHQIDRPLHPHGNSLPAIASALDKVYPVNCVAKLPALAPLLTAFQTAGIQSLLILALSDRDRCVGCLTLFRSAAKESGAGWTNEELQLAQNLACQMYLAVMEQRVEQMVRDRLYHDILTGLPNRMLLSQWLNLALSKMPAQGEFLAVIVLNLTRFKNINDSLGHRCGDRLLQLIAERLQHNFDNEATIGRWSGDEFVMIIPAVSDITSIERVADRTIACFDLPFVFDRSFPRLKTNSLYIKVSMGIAIATSGSLDSESLLQHADTALTQAKSNGKNSYEIYTDAIIDPVNDRLQLENILDRAISDCKLFLHYQPQLDILTGKIIGIEALLRCQDLHGNSLSPAELIPIAEETGSIVPIGEWVIRTACQQNKIWQDLGLGDFPIAVNFSVKQLQNRNLIETIATILAETGLPATALEIEITESIAIKDLDLTISILQSLRQIGVKISLDDFGTGYSSLAALKYLPLDRLKIDRSFMQGLRANSIDVCIVRTIINLGHELNLNVVAEGVETVEQFECLRSINCDAVQGFLFSRPLTASELEVAIATGSYLHQNLFHVHN